MDSTQSSIAEVAAAIGMAAHEVVKLEVVDQGGLITTSDGKQMIVVPEDRPDYEGKTGLMWWHPPHAKYSDPFPVYCHTAPAGGAVGVDATEVANPPVDPDAGTVVDPAAAAEARAALEVEAVELGVDYEGVADEELWLAVQAAKDDLTVKAAFDAAAAHEALLAEAVALGVKKPQRLNDAELLAAVEALRPLPEPGVGDNPTSTEPESTTDDSTAAPADDAGAGQ